MTRALTSALGFAMFFSTGCDAELAGLPMDSGLDAASLCRASDGAFGCQNVESSFTMRNTDTMCWKGIGGAYLFAMPTNGVCPAGYNGPIATNQNPANKWTLCGLAEIMAPAPGPCVGSCTDHGVQVSYEQTATSCKAIETRICKDPAPTDAADLDQ